jgi:hypothetical protein
MSTSHVATYGSTVTLTATDTDGVLKKIARSVLATGVGEALNSTAGTYTPTFTNVAGITSLDTTYSHYYQRRGDIVTVTGAKQITTSGAGVASFRVSLPVAATIQNTAFARGPATSGSADYIGGTTFGTAASDDVTVSVRVGAGSAIDVAYCFSYEV